MSNRASYWHDNESVIIRPMGGGDFHALIGIGDMSGSALTRAVYELIEAGEPIHGTWINYREEEADPTHTTVLHLAGRHAVTWVSA
jgi:hypothetical protein